MVLRSQRDGLGSSSQAPRGRTSGTRGDIDVPAVGQRSGAQGPDSKGRASRSGVWVCGATLTWLHGWAGGAGEGIASSDRTLLPTGEERGGWECGDGVSRTAILALLGPGEKGNCSYEVLGTTDPGASGGTEQKFSTRPSSGGRSGAIAISWRAGSRGSGSPSQGRRLPWHFTGLAGAEAGRAAFLRPAPCCGHCEGCCCGRAGAEVEAAGGRLRRRAGGGAAAGGGVETAADRRGRMRNASICFCAAENCWAKSSTASPNRPAWEIGESRKRCLSDSLISAKVMALPWLSSPLARGPSLCAVPATHLGQHHPRAAVSTPWPGGPAGGPWRAGRKRPVQQHRKPWPLERTRTYRPWTEGVDYPSRRQRPAGKAAWQWRAQLGGPPHTPGPLRRRGWWGRRRH